ncbi:hypothetical protein V8C37DRAFT_369094 [Trichoderma ceciliae]
MKSAAIATLGLLAGLASAGSPIRHLHFPRSNSTITPVDDAAPTTLTVFATSVHTVISCAPTVTNCPARTNQTGLGSLPESAKTTMVVTDTIVLATTICPVAQASSVSSSLQAAHSSGKITGSTLTPTAPAVTTPANGSSAAAVGVSVTDVAIGKTLTMTMGKGTDASVITTTVQATTRETITITSTLSNGETGPEPTTTTTATTTDTTVITVTPVQTAGGSSGSSTGGNAPPANGDNGANGAASCEGAPTVTVTVAKETVTVPASTVFVTIAPSSCDSSSSSAVTGQAIDNGSGSGSDSSSGSIPSPSSIPSPESSSSGSVDSGNTATPVTTDCPYDITTTVRATVTVPPIPANNGTVISGIARPSGFARFRR